MSLLTALYEHFGSIFWIVPLVFFCGLFISLLNLAYQFDLRLQRTLGAIEQKLGTIVQQLDEIKRNR